MNAARPTGVISISPLLIFLIIAASAFASEALVMLLLQYLPQESVLGNAFTDAALLVILISPTLYFFLFRPMIIHIAERQKAEETLHKNEEEQFKTMIRTSLDGFSITDTRGRFLEVNDSYCQLLGYSREELLNMGVADVEAVETSEKTTLRIARLIENGSDRFETRLRRKDGHILDVEISSNYSPAFNRHFYCFIRDITQHKQDKEQLRKSEARLQATLDNSPYMIWQKDPAGRYIAFNQAFLKTTGKQREQDVLGKTDMDLWPLELAEKYRTDDIEVMLSGKQKILEEQATNNGVTYWVETCKTPIIGENRQIFGTTGFAQDISERKLAEQILLENEARLQELFENLNSGVAVYRASPDGHDFTITAFNGAAERIENMRREELISKKVEEVFPGITEFGLLEVFRRVWKSGVAEHFPVSFYQDGRIAGWRENYVYKLPNGEIAAIYDDVTKEKQAEEQMYHLAHHDALTSLSNRALFTDRLRQALSTAKRDKSHLGLMFIDLDKFKPVNDTLGHDVGDLLLKEVAKRMLGCVRESDTVSRIGGDEFVVLLPFIEEEQDAMIVAEKILHALSQPFELAGHSIHISSSIGIAIYPEHGEQEKLLVKNADIAMYYAKEGGRNNARLYQPDMYNRQ